MTLVSEPAWMRTSPTWLRTSTALKPPVTLICLVSVRPGKAAWAGTTSPPSTAAAIPRPAALIVRRIPEACHERRRAPRVGGVTFWDRVKVLLGREKRELDEVVAEANTALDRR